VRRASSTLVAVAFLAVCRTASGQNQPSPDETGMNLHQVYMPMDGHGFYVVDDARTLEQWQLHGYLNYSRARRPLEAAVGQSSSRPLFPIVEHQDMLDVGASIGLWPKELGVIHGLSFGMNLPINVYERGVELPYLQRSLGSGGVGALRLQAKADLIETNAPKDDFFDLSFGVKPFVTVPTGRTRHQLSDRDTATWGGMMMGSIRMWRVRLGGEFGYEFTPHIVLGDLDIRDRVRWGLGLELLILNDEAPWAASSETSLRHTASIGIEGFGWADAYHFFDNNRTRPVEAFMFAKYANSWGLFLSAGWGFGVNHGVSAPRERFMLRIGWTF
jgi:hypothetical protein